MSPQQVSEFAPATKALLDGEILVTILRPVSGNILVDVGHGTLLVPRERLTLLA